jgi:sugar lactone lactonase YvrE
MDLNSAQEFKMPLDTPRQPTRFHFRNVLGRHPAATAAVVIGLVGAIVAYAPSFFANVGFFADVKGVRAEGAEPVKKKQLKEKAKPMPDEPDDADAGADGDPENPGLPHPFPRRSPAAELTGGVEWINVGGPLELEQLRGKFVLLDFWTYCCINCMHILPELKKLEAEFPNELVVIGVHSAKFDGEKDTRNITEAVMRHEIQHPVVNDANHVIWDNFFVSSWPSLRIIDPEGNLVGGHSGEIDVESLRNFFNSVLPYYRQRGLIDETPLRFDLAAFQSRQTPLRYPGKVLADAAGKRLFIADSNHNRIVVTTLDGQLQETIGAGTIGKIDGDFAAATFDHPQGMALDGETLYVADTENHLLRKIDLTAKIVSTIAGTGGQHRGPWPGVDISARTRPKRYVGSPRETGLNSPWDLWIHERDLYVAMAGPHQIWKMPLDESEIGPFAGNGREDIVDGRLLPPEPYEEGFSSFAQPSGLTSDGKSLFVADSEGSSIRSVPFDSKGKVKTIVGSAHLDGGRLFAFGDQDGEGNKILLQHALGVTWHDGLLYVADTYNNKIKVVNPARRSSKTLVGTGQRGTADDPAEFFQPAGISVAGDVLYVADTNNHIIRTIDLANGNRVGTLAIAGLEPPATPVQAEVAHPEPKAAPIEVARTSVRPDGQSLRLQARIALPDGFKINPLAPLRYRIEAAGEGPVDRQAIGKQVKVEPPSAEFDIIVPLAQTAGSDVLEVAVNYYYCQEGAEGVCKAARAVWRVPVDLDAAAEATSVELKVQAE